MGALTVLGNYSVDKNAFGTNISDLYDGDGRFTFIGDTNTATHITFVKAGLPTSAMKCRLMPIVRRLFSKSKTR